jgi:molybdenum cofactor biosynthesis protein MoaC
MVNITHKSNTLRQAIATAVVQVSSQLTIDAINNKAVPKGDIFEFARAAGLLAIKKTSDVIPDCHPLPIEYAAITYHIEDLSLQIFVEVHTIYKTGVEVEAMHGAAITALTIYDMLKPIDKNVEIGTVKLLSKKGGKTDFKNEEANTIKVAVLVCSDSIAAGKKEDTSGKKIIEKLKAINIDVSLYEIVADDIMKIQTKAMQLCDADFNLVLLTGGTGLSARDVTPEAIKPLIERNIPGISEIARNYGQQRMPYAMLSRSVAGFIKNTLFITMPGSVSGVNETMDALFPQVLHIFKLNKGERHD